MGRVFYDARTGDYGASGHPEAPFRVLGTAKRLASAGHKLELPPVAAKDEDAALLHAPTHLKSIRKGDWLDADTPDYPRIADIAMISLSGALSAAESAVAGGPGFSLMRPPGHHAGKDRVAGFCYLNNIALACAKLQAEKKAERIAILDIDVHHGDGTESLVLNRDGIRFASLHQFPLYPGTGGESRGNCENVPLAEGTDEESYLSALEPVLQRLLDFKPDLLAVSAGFDTYKEDPIAGLKLDVKSYRRIGALLGSTKLKRFAVLEGGYAQDMPKLVESFLDGFFQ
jgi:acetoin utilization deacetylase AcuC-like enzyme